MHHVEVPLVNNIVLKLACWQVSEIMDIKLIAKSAILTLILREGLKKVKKYDFIILHHDGRGEGMASV